MKLFQYKSNKVIYDNKKSFTLIELLVVIGIIAIIAGITISSLSDIRKKAADTAIKAGMNQLRTHAELYYGNNYSYGGFGTCPTSATEINFFSTNEGFNILKNISDNAGGVTRVYCYVPPGGTSYVMTAKLRSPTITSCPGTQSPMWCIDQVRSGREICLPSSGVTSCPDS